MDDIDFAQSMRRSTSSSQMGRSVRRTDTSTVYGTAMSDSADGSVRVDLGGSIIGGDGMVGVTCPTTVTVRKGDTVLVQLVGARGTAQSPIVVGCVGRGDVQQGEINEAKEEADEAKTAAEQAKQSAKDAADAASDAQQSASDAADAAQDAIDEAGKATKAAGDAMEAATSAGAAAVEANTAARGAVAGLGQVQDVIGTLDWIREHGTYALTEDTTVDPSKVYYTRSGTAPDYTYAPVAEPKDEELATYYELSMDEALAEFVGAHLALLSDGLHIVSDASGYYIVLSNEAMKVYDPNGTLVAEYGDDIELYQAGVLALKLSDDGMKLFDGLGTDETNVIAHFNENGVTLGQNDISKTHAIIFFDSELQSGGFGVYNVDEEGVPSYTGIENGHLTIGGPNYDESNSHSLEATNQDITLAEGWMAPEVGMSNKSSGKLMFYGWDTSFGATVDYRVDWNGNISTTGKVTAKGDVSGGSLQGRQWDYNTNNTTDTWVPVTTTVNGVAKWQHRVIPTRLTTEASTSIKFYTSTTSANVSGYLWRRGGMVGIAVNGLYIYKSSGRAYIGLIPSGWRPPALFFGTTGISTKVGFEPDGRIWVDPETATNNNIWFSGVWPLA